MNLKALNILFCLLLTSCSSFYKNKEGENINKNAPIFVRPNTNQPSANKAPETKPVEYKSEKYILVKETELNLLINKKASERTTNKAPAPAPHKEEPLVGENSPIGENSPLPTQPNEKILAPETFVLTPVKQEKDSSSPLMNHILVVALLTIFFSATGVLLFDKLKKLPAQPQPKKTKVEKKN